MTEQSLHTPSQFGVEHGCAPAAAPTQALQGSRESRVSRHRYGLWAAVLGSSAAVGTLVCTAISIAVILALILPNRSEMDALGTWPGAEVSPQELISVDLSDLGLSRGQVQNARDEEGGWSSHDWDYAEGVRIDYVSGDGVVAAVWALKYADAQTAGQDFAAATEWARQACGTSISGFGVIRCGYSDGYEKIYWHDVWIVNIATGDAGGPDYEAQVNQVRDAIAGHWQNLSGRLQYGVLGTPDFARREPSAIEPAPAGAARGA